VTIVSAQPCGSDRRELRRERDFRSGPEGAGAGGVDVGWFPFATSLFLSFDRAPLVRPFDVVLGLVFARLGFDDGAGPGESVAAVAVVVGVVAVETG